MDLGKKTCVAKTSTKKVYPYLSLFFIPSHIHPRCFKYLKALKNGMLVQIRDDIAQSKPKTLSRRNFGSKKTSINRVWIRKSDIRYKVAYLSLKACNFDSWYFDSGCSRHMTSDRSNLTNFQTLDEGFVTFGMERRDKFFVKVYLIFKDYLN